jgi:hypothetical protein
MLCLWWGLGGGCVRGRAWGRIGRLVLLLRGRNGRSLGFGRSGGGLWAL